MIRGVFSRDRFLVGSSCRYSFVGLSEREEEILERDGRVDLRIKQSFGFLAEGKSISYEQKCETISHHRSTPAHNNLLVVKGSRL